MMKVVVGYPSGEEEALVVERSLRPPAVISPILTADSLAALQALTADVYVDRRSSTTRSRCRRRPVTRSASDCRRSSRTSPSGRAHAGRST